ncbi:MAG: hypothetical protein WBX22_07435 [Silvibacterium sp.]
MLSLFPGGSARSFCWALSSLRRALLWRWCTPTMLVSPHDEINGAVRVYAGYLAARNGALAMMLVVLLVLGARRSLSSLMVLTALIQGLDAVLDIAEGRWMIVPGVLIFALVFLITAARLSGYPFWRAEAWAR